EGSPLAALAEECAAIGRRMLGAASLDDRLAGGVPFCTMCAAAEAGRQLQRQREALAGAGTGSAFARRRAATEKFVRTHIVSEALGLAGSARAGAGMLYAIDSGTLTG